jgi:hypothetical protein
MDSDRFDRLVKTFSTPDTRRGLLRLVAGVPVAGALAALFGEGPDAGAQQDPERGSSHRRHRRKARHDPGKDKDNRKGLRKGNGQRKGKRRRCAQAGQTLKKGKRKTCCAGLVKDASGRCAAAAPPSSSSPTCLSPTSTSPTQGLQEAIDAAAAGATLTLCAGTWTLSETVVIAKNLTLVGAGAGATTLDGGRPPSGPGGVRVLTIDPGAEVTLQDLTITKGRATGDRFPDNAGGGISNQGTLTLIGVSVTGNTGRIGGGIYNGSGTVTLAANSSVSGNTANSLGGGIYTLEGMVTLQADSQVSGNTAGFGGGGIYNDEGTVTIEAESRVSGNRATNYGGGIVNSDGTVTVASDALVCDNSPSTSQCHNISSTITGPCPNPPGGSCPN